MRICKRWRPFSTDIQPCGWVPKGFRFRILRRAIGMTKVLIHPRPLRRIAPVRRKLKESYYALVMRQT
jgi:hypothetical protein